MGFGDGYKDFIYRSDNKDISILNKEYTALRNEAHEKVRHKYEYMKRSRNLSQDYEHYEQIRAEEITKIFDRTGVKDTPIYLQIQKIKDHWFWQVAGS